MNSKSTNIVLNNDRMEALGLVSLKLPPPWWWNTEDLEDEKAKGSVFSAHKETGGLSIASIVIADVTGDPDELNISLLDEDGAKEYDQVLHRGAKETLSNQGMELISWMSSQLNETETLKGLVTAYIVKDQGKERQMIALRTRVREFNLVLIGSFDITMKDELAIPIFDTIRGAIFLPPSS